LPVFQSSQPTSPYEANHLIQRRSLHDAVTERIRDMIVEGDLNPGERLSEKELCKQFGISRTPLREALKVLASEDLVELPPNRGAHVSQITAADVAERFEVLSSLEQLAGELAAERASKKDIEQIAKVHERMVRHYKKSERHEYFVLNQRIHNGIIELSGNSVLATTHASLMSKVRRVRYLALQSQDRWDEAVREHEEILAALIERNSKRLGEVIRLHVRETGEVVEQSLDHSQHLRTGDVGK